MRKNAVHLKTKIQSLVSYLLNTKKSWSHHSQMYTQMTFHMMTQMFISDFIICNAALQIVVVSLKFRGRVSYDPKKKHTADYKIVIKWSF